MSDIPADAVYVDVDYYADGFYRGRIWLPAWADKLPREGNSYSLNSIFPSERREMVMDLIRARHPSAKRVDVITAKYVKEIKP